MFEIHWYTILIIVIALLGSSVIGGLIYAGISKYLNRPQPIGRRVDAFPRFEDTKGASPLRTNITVSDGQKSYKYDDLQIVEIQLSHQGDQNFDEFKFGIKLSEGNRALYIEAQPPDRHHQVEQLTPLTGTESKSEIDFILRPFNKTETYSLRLLMVRNEGSKEPEEIDFSSPQAVRFVYLPTTKEIIEETARSASISFGPFSMSLGG